MSAQYRSPRSAGELAAQVERAIRSGELRPGDQLAPIRSLAAEFGLATGTVAAAYRQLRERGFVVGERRRGTVVAPVLAAPARVALGVPPDAVDLAGGNPDVELLPPLAPVLSRLGAAGHRYGEPTVLPQLAALAGTRLAEIVGDASSLAVVGGALDGIERCLQANLRAGDAVAVEDPGFTSVFDLLASMHLRRVPVAVDERGPDPDALAGALGAGVHAFVLTPRAQNPGGGYVDARRAAALRPVLQRHPDVLVIEDDHAGPVAGVPATTLTGARQRWAFVHSVSKSLGPDLRLAVVAGDATTIGRVNLRQRVGTGWVSTLLQECVVHLWRSATTERRLRRAASTYTARRSALVDALAAKGVPAQGASGLNVWVPVAEEQPVVQALLERGWLVAAGERFRIASPPGIRVCTASLPVEEAGTLADDIAAVLAGRGASRLA